MQPGTRRWLERGRQAALFVVLVAGAVLFGWIVNRQYAIQAWLFWRYAGYWVATLALCVSALSLGHVIVRKLVGRTLPALEHYAVAFSFGILGFEVLMFLAGLLHLYHWVLFFALPLLAGAPGLPSLWKMTRRYARHLRATRRSRPALRWPGYAAVAFGCLALGMLYFEILSPENASFDSRWMHMALAEDFVASGAVHRFPDANNFATGPHFGSFLYTWAFLLPRSLLFDHMELCMHIEFAVFLITTVVGIAALVRRLVPRADPRLVWAARFLFPGVLLYDSNLGGGADHLSAMWGIPIALFLIRAWRDLKPRYCAALGVGLAGATMTKYTGALLLVPFPILAIAARSVWLAVRAARRRLQPAARGNWYLGPLMAALAALVAAAPHWLRNIIWYGDPLYPTLAKIFTHRPWVPDAAYTHGVYMAETWHPHRNLHGVKQTLEVLGTFSFIPNDWDQFHGKFPVFGSLFTLFILCLPFLRKTARIWGLVLWVHVGLIAWYWVHHQDRYLQAIMPVIAAATAAMLVLIWRSGRHVVRGALSLLVALQIVWGGDVYFFPTHAMSGSPIKKVVDLLAGGFKKQFGTRLGVQGEMQALGKRLPAHAVVLLHGTHGSLGVAHPSVTDVPGWQYGLSYGYLRSFREVYDVLHAMGVTHLYYSDNARALESVASDLMFNGFANRYTSKRVRLGRSILATMPDKPPSAAINDKVVVFGCPRRYNTGLYKLSDLRVPVYGPDRRRFPAPRQRASLAEATRLLGQAGFAVVETTCHVQPPADLSREFDRIVTRSSGGRETLWMRR